MSATLTDDDVRKVARLARLKLSASEVATFRQQLGAVLEYVELLNEAETSDVLPMAHAIELENVLRPDEARPSLPREQALANAPKQDGTYFLVPQIIEGA